MKPDGKIGDASAENIQGGLVRIDIWPEWGDRFAATIDINTARAFTVMLIQAIEKAETYDALQRKARSKK